MQADDVLSVIDALNAAGLGIWLDGGWGLDALLGAETRTHDDVDVVVELAALDVVRAAHEPLGFELTEDHLPTRAVLTAPDGRQVDLHPITFAHDETGWQRHAAPDGSDCSYPVSGFGQGTIRGRVVPCLTSDAKIRSSSLAPASTQGALRC